MPLLFNITLPDRPDPENIRKLDILPIPMLNKMQRYGFRIDLNHFRDLSSRLSARKRELRVEILNEIPPEALDKFVVVDEANDDEANDDDDGESLLESSSLFNVESSEKVASLIYDTLGLHLRGIKIK